MPKPWMTAWEECKEKRRRFIPDWQMNPKARFYYLLLEDGGKIILEDDSCFYILLEESVLA